MKPDEDTYLRCSESDPSSSGYRSIPVRSSEDEGVQHHVYDVGDEELNSGVRYHGVNGWKTSRPSDQRVDTEEFFIDASLAREAENTGVDGDDLLSRLGMGAFSAPERTYRTKDPDVTAPTSRPQSFFDSVGALHKSMGEFHRDLAEIQRGFRGLLFPDRDPEVQPVPKVDTRKALVKLETMEAWEVDLCVVALYTAIAIGFLYTTIYVSLTKGTTTPLILAAATKACMVVISFCSFLLAVFYIVRIVSLKSVERTDEQFWTCILLASGLLGQSPFTQFPKLVGNAYSYSRINELFVWSVIVDAVYSACTYFFIMCTVHSYRILGAWELYRLRFYTPKFVLIGFYVFCRILFTYWGGVHLGFVPLTRIMFLPFFVSAKLITTKAMISVGVITCLELGILTWFVREISTTRMFLARLNYMETRGKQLGFRFFLYTSVCFLVAIFLIDAYLMGGIPESQLRAIAEHLDYVEFSPVFGKLGLGVMFFAWLALTAYGNFPAGKFSDEEQSSGTKSSGGMRVGLDRDVPRSLLYKHRDWASSEVAQRNHIRWNNVFVMEVQVLMINCAWLAYIPMNKEEERQPTDGIDHGENDEDLYRVDMHEIVESRGLAIVQHIYDEATDGHCIIVEDDGRIVVSFGGTREGSVKNWWANFRFNQVKWTEWFHPLSQEPDVKSAPSPAQESQSILKQVAEEVQTFRDVKVHAGFADMYQKLRGHMMLTLVELFHRNSAASKKLLFFTGHSLGGAMATLASYDCALNFRQLGLRTRKQIQVTTFGTPKVGNLAWKTSYEKKVSSHWRFVLASDVVTKMPQNWNYFHVGVKVLLDWSGMLLVDPSFVEVRWWHTVYTSTTLHTRSSYYLSMRAWCRRYRDAHGRPDDLHDAFWPWPIRPQQCRLFVNVEATPGL